MTIRSLLLAAVLVSCSNGLVHADNFVPLFNANNLDGWVGDPALWSIHDGVITGTTDHKKLTHNSFLASTKEYKNFRLKAQYKLRNHNTGIQFRSKQHPDFVVRGYQADISDDHFNGILYEEGGRGILANVKSEEVGKHFKKGDWNEYDLEVIDGHIVQKLNGYTTVDYQEKGDGAKSGILALQLHAGPNMEVQYRNLEIEDLSSPKQETTGAVSSEPQVARACPACAKPTCARCKCRHHHRRTLWRRGCRC